MIPGGEAHVRTHAAELRRFFRQQQAVTLPEGATTIDRFSQERWNPELAIIYYSLAVKTIGAFAREVADRYGVTADPSELREFLRPYARISAEATNATTAQQLQSVLESGDDIREGAEHVFDVAAESRSFAIAAGKVTTEANLGRAYAGQKGGAKVKRWITTSGKPRPNHARLHGEETEIRGTFSNGAQWPGDPILQVKDRAMCACIVEVE